MRLLKSDTIRLEYFQDTETTPPYAILSHTWGPGEITFKDISAEKAIENHDQREGYLKIVAACRLAVLDGWDYIWIDTCCIDKDSTSELSEAINSMYTWYQNSQVCYTYLVDVPSTEEPRLPNSAFSSCRWFSRGWTLQELLAPSTVIFYGKDWCEIGTKASLSSTISRITNIQSGVLLANHGGEVSVSKRMSWAANRQTTRIEDRAYSLLGLFGVNMPMIYGEGSNAFRRLQQEIMKQSDDHTIFAWRANRGDQGMLAHSPADFADSATIVRIDNHSPYSMTNKGLHIDLPLTPIPNTKDIFMAVLGCRFENESTPLCIFLKQIRAGHYLRTALSQQLRQQISINLSNLPLTTIFVGEPDSSKLDIGQWMRPQKSYIYSVTMNIPRSYGFRICERYPVQSWSSDTFHPDGERLTIGGSGTSGVIMFQNSKRQEKFAIMLGIHNFSMWTDIVTNFGSETAESIQKSYYKDAGRGGKLWQNLDRMSANLSQQVSVNVSVRKKMYRPENQRYMHAEIAVERTNSIAIVPPPFQRPDFQYVYQVPLPDLSTHTFQLVEAVSGNGNDNCWMDAPDKKLLCMKHSGTSGILMFTHKTTNEKFAVMMGIHNYEVWTDIVTNFGSESAKDIRNSYYKDNGRGDTLWLQRTSSSAPLKHRLSAHVAVRKQGPGDFLAEIKIDKK